MCVKKIKSDILVPFVLMALMISSLCLADASSELDQANSHMRGLQYPQAVAEYQAIITNYPGSDYALKAHKNLAITYILMQKLAEPQQVIDEMMTGFAGNPGLPEAAYRVATRCALAGNYEMSNEIYQLVLSRFPQTTFGQKAEIDVGKTNIQDLLVSGEHEDAQTAIQQLESDFAGREGLTAALCQIAKEYEHQDRLEEAAAVYQKAISSNTEAGNRYLNESKARAKQVDIMLMFDAGNDSQARAQLSELVTELGGMPKVHGWRILRRIARQCEKLGNFSQAESIYQQIATSYPSSKDAAYVPLELRKVAVRAAIDADDYAGADALTGQLKTDYAGNSRLTGMLLMIAEQYSDRGNMLEQAGEQEAALAAFEKALAIWQEIIDTGSESKFMVLACRWAGICYRHLERYEEALQCYQKIVEEYPGSYWARYALFMVGWNSQKLKEQGRAEAEQADTVTRIAYQQLIAQHPQYKLCRQAQIWLNENNKN
jgi:tetratricopeptide (TPR) repeat protein